MAFLECQYSMDTAEIHTKYACERIKIQLPKNITLTSPGIEPGSTQPQCDILTTVRTSPMPRNLIKHHITTVTFKCHSLLLYFHIETKSCIAWAQIEMMTRVMITAFWPPSIDCVALFCLRLTGGILIICSLLIATSLTVRWAMILFQTCVDRCAGHRWWDSRCAWWKWYVYLWTQILGKMDSDSSDTDSIVSFQLLLMVVVFVRAVSRLHTL